MTRRLLPYAEPVRCSLCNGEGVVSVQHPSRDPQRETMGPCPSGCVEQDTRERPTAAERKAKGRAWEGSK